MRSSKWKEIAPAFASTRQLDSKCDCTVVALVLVDRDWKSKKIYKSLRAHDGPVVGCITHPLEASKVATCSWDGLIKYWD